MSIAKTIAKNSLYNFITTTLGTLAVFIVGIVLARYLGTEQYGLYSLMMWLLSIAVLVANVGVSEMIKRFIAEAMGQKNSRTAKGIIQLAFIIRCTAALLVSLLIIVLSGYLARIFNMPTSGTYFMYIGVALFPYLLSLVFTSIFAGFQKYEYITIAELVVSPFRVVIVILLVIFGFGMKEILLSYAAVWAVGMLIGFFLFRRLVQLRDLFLPSLLESATRKSALKYSFTAMGVLSVDYFLWQQAEVMFLGMYRPVMEVGFYNIAYKIPIIVVTLIPIVFGQVLLPAVSEQYGKGDMEKIKKIYVTAARCLMMLSLPLAAAGIALARPLINLLYGPEYAPAIVLMQIVFIPIALRGLSYAVISVIYGIKEPAYLLKVGAILVCISIGLNLWLIPKYGAIGAVVATSIPRVFSLPIYIIFVSRKIKMRWPMGDTVKVAIASVGIGLVVFVLQHYLESAILSICVSVPVGIIVFFIALMALGVVRKQDLVILKQLEQRLPLLLRGGFAVIIGVLGKFARQESK